MLHQPAGRVEGQGHRCQLSSTEKRPLPAGFLHLAPLQVEHRPFAIGLTSVKILLRNPSIKSQRIISNRIQEISVKRRLFGRAEWVGANCESAGAPSDTFVNRRVSKQFVEM
jgi:hypothetical protein